MHQIFSGSVSEELWVYTEIEPALLISAMNIEICSKLKMYYIQSTLH